MTFTSSKTPSLFVEIAAPLTLFLSASFTLTVTLQHHGNPIGNPQGNPVLFRPIDTGAMEMDGMSIGRFLVLHHNKDGLKEVDDDDDGCRLELTDSADRETSVTAENGFISLAPGETFPQEVGFTYKILDLEIGQKYSLLYQGWYVQWWQWGSLEVSLILSIFQEHRRLSRFQCARSMQDHRETKMPPREQINQSKQRKITLAASNMVEFMVVD